MDLGRYVGRRVRFFLERSKLQFNRYWPSLDDFCIKVIVNRYCFILFHMPADRNMSDSLRSIVVAGDVCIDWLSIFVDPVVGQIPNNWQLKGGRHMFARRGGAWLTADLVAAAARGKTRVCKPECRDQLEAISPNELIHSMLVLDRFPRQRDGKKVYVWGVRGFEGFAGPADGHLIKPPPRPECDDPQAEIVVLDDAGNGFRDQEVLWPAAIRGDAQPTVLYKVRRPLLQGPLWEQLSKSHLPRTIVFLNADELRAMGIPISRHLSWERTAADLVLALAHNKALAPLKNCAHVVIPLGLEGVVHFSCTGHDRKPSSRLWYLPDRIENDLLDEDHGGMTGFASAFTAALAAELARCPREERLSCQAVYRGIRKGMNAVRHLLDLAFGTCKDEDGRTSPPTYPREEIFTEQIPDAFSICEVDFPEVPLEYDLRQIERFRDWRILDRKRLEPILDYAHRIAKLGLKKVLPELPIARFGYLETIDRWEIESYRGLRNLIREFLKVPKPDRPLCVAVFGRPGSGKSFGVTQVAQSVARGGQIEKFDFNLSQWDGPEKLAVALHRVRDSALRGKVPLVFFDEFDSSYQGQPFGWLKYFLAPMQDGVFTEGHFTHQIGRAIFVFAGGVCESFQKFRAEAESSTPQVKATDFLSRLRGHIDVFGINPLADANMLRRAMLLRSLLSRKQPQLFDATKTLQIDDGLLSAFLAVPLYHHGVRSMEALIEMSQVQGVERFVPAQTPSKEQLSLHVDGAGFARIVESPGELRNYLEKLAEEIHARFIADCEAKAQTPAEKEALKKKDSFRDWADLDEIYRDSNRDQAANIPVKLAAIGCDFAPLGPGESPSSFKFRGTEPSADGADKIGEIEKLARMEHERWMDERRLRQPHHPALLSWENLPLLEKQKDLAAIEALPELLHKVGLKIVRVKG